MLRPTGADRAAVRRVLVAAVFCVFALRVGPSGATAAAPYFRITILDNQTNRGVPGVQLTTTNQAIYITDSAGVVAFYRPDLMGKLVWFSVATPGYTAPTDGFGWFYGAALTPTPGGSGVIRITRNNIARRLYRVTGVDIYQDSAILGDPVPPTQDPSSSPVMTQRSGESVVYGGKSFWMGNDTNAPDSLAANLKATGATALLPSQGGLDPETGVSFQYFREGQAVKPMIDIGYDAVRAGCLRVAIGDLGAEKLIANYHRLGPGSSIVERGLLQFDDGANQFEKLSTFPSNAILIPDGTAFAYTDAGTPYFYCANPWPTVRSWTSVSSIQSLQCQGLTCLRAGSRLNYTGEQIDRDDQGNLLWGWAANTSPIGEAECDSLLGAGLITQGEQWLRPTDVTTTARVRAEAGSICWNPYRQRWLALCTETGGKSPHGEVWYFEGDTPLGPWVYGQKIVTHSVDDSTNYSFLSPVQHPELDKAGGRFIFFDGTFTNDLASARFPLPRYNGNRVMYELDLADSRLFLPVPVYRVEGTPVTYRTKTGIANLAAVRTPLFFAPDRPRATTNPIYEYPDLAHGTVVLSASITSPTGQPGTVVFYAVDAGVTSVPNTVPLNEFIHGASQVRVYTTDDTVSDPGYTKSPNPVCRVWFNPVWKFNPYNLATKTASPGKSGVWVLYY